MFSDDPAICRMCKSPIEEVYRLQQLCEDCLCFDRKLLWPPSKKTHDDVYVMPSDDD
jgi:hypothetical protein